VSRVFISSAHESDAHAEAVRDLRIFLRANEVDAQIDRVVCAVDSASVMPAAEAAHSSAVNARADGHHVR
jgi:hypothetical protein